MIAEFLDSWDLFYLSFLAGWLSALCLPLAGVLVIGRRQVFLGASLAQSSIFGIALILFLEGMGILKIDPHLASHSASIIFSVLGALLIFSLAHRGRTHNEVSALLFLFCSSGAVLLVSGSPHGTEEVHALTVSTLLGASRLDVWTLFIILVVLVSPFLWKNKELGLYLLDPETAGACGLRVGLRDLGSAVVIGAVVGFCLKVTGFLFVFAFLVLPVLAAREWVLRFRFLPVLSCVISLLCCSMAFLLSVNWDLPPAQVAVFILSLSWFLSIGLKFVFRLMSRK